MVKMICLDIDGTLLNSRHFISPGNKAAIRAASQKNIPVILVSARMPDGIIPFQDELGIHEPLICYSGALVLDKQRKTVSEKTIPLSLTQQLYAIALEEKQPISLYRENNWYVESLDKWALQESAITHMHPVVAPFPQLWEEWRNRDGGPNKILFMARPEKIERIQSLLADVPLHVYPSKPTYLEIMPPEASKTSAIRLLCGYYHIKPEEVMAVGDNFNDMDMLRFAGTGVAMGNAPDAVKACANHITATNDEDGVAKAIAKYALT